MDRGLVHKSSPLVGEMGEAGHGWWSVNNLRPPFEQQHHPSLFMPSTTTAAPSSSSSSPLHSFSSLLLSNHYPLPTTSTSPPWHHDSSSQGVGQQDSWSQLIQTQERLHRLRLGPRRRPPFPAVCTDTSVTDSPAVEPVGDWTNMVGRGGAMRNVMSLYRKFKDGGSEAAGSSGAKGRKKKAAGGGRGRGKRRERTPVPSSSSSDEDFVPSAADTRAAEHEDREDVEHEAAEHVAEEHGAEEHGAEDPEGEDAEGSTCSENLALWQRGPSQLPKRPIPMERRPVIAPSPPRNWVMVTPGAGHARRVNGILGLLCRELFPGLVTIGGREEPAYTFDHYVAAGDQEDRERRIFNNKAERVKGELWDFYRCAPGEEASADAVAHAACWKLVKDLHYEARVQAVIDYFAALKISMKKREARNMKLTKEQYLAAIPWWCAPHPTCWEVIVDKWCSAEWAAQHDLCRERRLLMPGVSHHQGSLSLEEYRAKWSASHGGAPCSQLEAFAMAHKGKATSDVRYNPEDGPAAYSNASVHSRLTAYQEVAKEVHGPDWDPTAHDIDGEVVMRAGGGKKHGRYLIANNTIDTASTPTLSQIRARSTSSSAAIRQPLPFGMQALQARLDEETERRRQLELEVQQIREAEAEKDRQKEEAERANRVWQEQVFAYLQSIGQRVGEGPPPPMPPPPPPPRAPISPAPGSAASNDGPQDEDLAARAVRSLFGPPLP